MSDHKCDSCSMPIESGPYCQYCAPKGELIPFDECVERFMQWSRKQHPDLDDALARAQTLEFMAKMPAWKNDPRLAAARGW